jgi:Chaperone of endosialidase
MFERLNPQLQIEQQRLRDQLANQGVNAGGLAYQGAYDVYNRQANDARLGVIERGGVEQQRMNEMARNQAAFENAAQQQGFSQAQARAMFQNQTQAQAEGQNAARTAFYNQAAQQQLAEQQQRGTFYNQAQNQNFNMANAQFNAQNLLRGQALQEAYQQRAQPLNEITALLSGSQVQQPNFRNVQGNQMPTTDVAGLINQNFAQQNDIYKTQQGFWGDIIGGALGAGGNIGKAMIMSDRNVKEDIDRMGSILSDKGDRLPIYQYSYKDDPASRRHVGPMAQDVEKIDPSAVRKIGGVKHIDVGRMGSIFGSGAHA